MGYFWAGEGAKLWGGCRVFPPPREAGAAQGAVHESVCVCEAVALCFVLLLQAGDDGLLL